jgi:magnesium transporter
MNADPAAAIAALNRRYLLDYPREAAKRVESMPAAEAAGLLAAQPVRVIVPVWEYIAPDVEEALVAELPDGLLHALLAELEPIHGARLLSRLDEATRTHCLEVADAQIAQELRILMSYPSDTAGQLMDPHVLPFRADMTAREALERLRALRRRAVREIFLIDDEGRLTGRIELQELALAESARLLQDMKRGISAAVDDLAPREEVIEKLEQYKLADLPVVDFNGHLIGVIHQSTLVTAMQEEATLDIQTMVGASKDERALSKIGFAVIKRLPWLQINLLTAFLAASVVGLFENTIAKFSVLAVLMPVVAGQSGNAGAQALAVTMRGLALREISARQWLRVLWKEVNVGLLNGLAIAATTALGVYVWSRSGGLALVISLAMVISMIAAGFAGAVIPITLSRLGQDPAQSSSIIQTTVTDVVGFSSFLGIATLLSYLLPT